MPLSTLLQSLVIQTESCVIQSKLQHKDPKQKQLQLGVIVYQHNKQPQKKDASLTCCIVFRVHYDFQAATSHSPDCHTIVLQQIYKVRHDLCLAEKHLSCGWLQQTAAECPAHLNATYGGYTVSIVFFMWTVSQSTDGAWLSSTVHYFPTSTHKPPAKHIAVISHNVI